MRDKSTPTSVSNRRPDPDRSGSPAPLSEVATWVATIILALLIPALILPSGEVRADVPQISAPGTAIPGTSITVLGSGFSARERLSLAWDGKVIVKQVRVDATGRFSRSFAVSASAEPGAHTVSALSPRRCGGPRGAQPSRSRDGAHRRDVRRGATGRASRHSDARADPDRQSDRDAVAHAKANPDSYAKADAVANPTTNSRSNSGTGHAGADARACHAGSDPRAASTTRRWLGHGRQRPVQLRRRAQSLEPL